MIFAADGTGFPFASAALIVEAKNEYIAYR